MTGFDPTAPERDTSKDAPEEFSDNVVPPEELTGEDAPAAAAEHNAPADDATPAEGRS